MQRLLRAAAVARLAVPLLWAQSCGRPCAGVPIATTEDAHKAIDSRPPGTRFCLPEGVHRIDVPLAPRSRRRP